MAAQYTKRSERVTSWAWKVVSAATVITHENAELARFPRAEVVRDEYVFSKHRHLLMNAPVRYDYTNWRLNPPKRFMEPR